MNNQLRTERGSGEYDFLAGFILGAVVLGAVMGVGEYYHGNDAGYQKGLNDNRTVQLENQELQSSLDSTFDPVNQLVLNTKDHSFSFQTKDKHAVPETCTGTYKVGSHVVTVVGQLSCSRSVSAG